MIKINKRIKELRDKKGWSQQKLAKTSGVPYKTLVKIEQGSSKQPTLQNIIKLANIFDISIDNLIGRKTNNGKDYNT